MTIRLSGAMQRSLKWAPDDWRSMPPTRSLDALKRRGLIEVRNTPGETGIMAGFQYRISDSGKIVAGRCPPHDRQQRNNPPGAGQAEG